MGKSGCGLPSSNDIKDCVYGAFRGLSPTTGGHCQVVGSPVLLRKGASLQRAPEVKSIPAAWSASGLTENEETFYTSQAIACHSFFFPYALCCPSPAWSSDTLTAFSYHLWPSARERKRPGWIWSSCAWPSSLSWFVSFFFSFEKFLCCCSALGSSFFSPPPSSFTAFNCFGAFVFPWTGAQWERSTVSGGLYTADKAFRRLHWSH